MAPLDLSNLLKEYENKWVALSDDNKKVFGAGKTAKDALQDAKRKGHEDVTLMFVQLSEILIASFLSLGY